MNIYGKISEFFIANKKLSLLLLIGIIFWGSISFLIMPKQYNPDIVAPAFAINVEFFNATVDEVYHLVTKPLEDVINEIPGVENIYSKSEHGGRSSVIVEFFVGEDLEKSMITLRQKISSRLNLAPLGISEPNIVSIDPEELPVVTLVLHSDKMKPIELRKIGFQLKEDITHIKGISIVDVIGGLKREFQIILDPQKMKDANTSLNEIEQVLADTSILQDLGLIKTKDKFFKIETKEQAATIEYIEDIVITSNVEKNLKIKDVATVVSGAQERESYVNFYKKDYSVKDSVFIAISKQKGTNIIDFSKSIHNRLEDLRKEMPYLKGIEVDVVKDEGRVASEEIGGLVNNLIQAITIVFIVLLCFLNYRAAIIVASSIPITLLTVLALGNMFRYTINRITLFALILSLGMLVDSATVVIENIVRNKKGSKGASKDELISRSVAEVGAGLFLSTLTTVLAFIPMLFVTGMMGPYMGPIPFFVSTALAVSLIFAYTLNPWMAYVFCKDEVSSDIENKCGFICQITKYFSRSYQEFISSLLSDKKKRKAFLNSSFIVLILVMILPVVKLLRFRMLPKADREQVFVYIDLDRGSSIERSYEVSEKAANALKKQSDIESIQSFVGTPPVLDFNGLFRGVSDRRSSNQITLKLNLTHPDKRKMPSEELAYNYREILLKGLSQISDAKIKVVEDPPGPPVRATFYVKVKSSDPEILNEATTALVEKVKTIKEVKDIDISSLEQIEKYELYVDKEAAARAKVSVGSISKELQTIFSGRIIGVYHSDYNLEQEYILLRMQRDLRDNIDDLEKIFISNALGNHVPLSRFVKVVTKDQEDIILDDNTERVVYISGEMGKRSAAYSAIDLLGILTKFKMPDRKMDLTKFNLFGAEYFVEGHGELKIEIGGEWDLTVKVFRDLGMAMGVAIILIYLVLVAQFRSFTIPVLILGTIPLAMVGVIPGFALLFFIGRIYFSATSMIGVIALAGIVVNNAIIYIDYVIQIAKNHSSLSEVLLEAGMTRMRPILLTSVTTVLGSLVIASDPVWSGLAWAIVFGLSLSSVLTLIVFPSLMYEYLGEKWFKSIREE